jgi:Abscisic acid G-protein coupled receptor
MISPMRSQDKTSTSSDLVTQLLVYCVSLFPSVHIEVDDIASIARQISLALVGVIILSSIRLVLTGVARVRLCCAIIDHLPVFVIPTAFVCSQILRVTNRKLGASIMLLLLAQLMVKPFPAFLSHLLDLTCWGGGSPLCLGHILIVYTHSTSDVLSIE